MSWVASLDGRGAECFYPPFDKIMVRRSLRRGSLVIELDVGPVTAARHVLKLPLQAHAAGHVSMLALPGGSFSIVVAQGAKLDHKTLRLPRADGGGPVRLGYAWDCDAGWARFSVEQADNRAFVASRLAAPVPISLLSLTLFDAMEICVSDETNLSFLAVSNGIEPVGPLPGLGAKSAIDTPFGPRILSNLSCGDMVVLKDGDAPEPVLHVAKRTVPALGSFAPIRLRAPYFGLHRDLIVSPHQNLFFGGTDVEYTFGCEGVLVPAGHLVNGVWAIQETHVSLVTYAQVLLPTHAVLTANGARLESMFIGRLRRDRDRQEASVLAGVNPSFVPEQVHLPYPLLRSYEAKALLAVA